MNAFVCSILATRAFAGDIVDGEYIFQINKRSTSLVIMMMNDIFESKSPPTLETSQNAAEKEHQP